MISPETIAAVRDRVDIVALIGENVRLKKHGRRWLGLCPFHKEKTPSFSVNQERGVFYCFGCKESGSAIDYVMKLEGYNFPEAVRALAERCGVEVEESGSPADREQAERRRRDNDDLFAINQMVATYWEQQLGQRGHPLRHHAIAELERRGLADALGDDEGAGASLKAFRIGYAPAGWDNLVAFLQRQGASLALAEKLGVIVARRGSSGHYDAFRHRLMFAVVDKTGRVVAFSGRALDEPTDEELKSVDVAPRSPPKPGEKHRPPPKYINSPESPIYVKGETVFGLHQARLAIREQELAVLVEGNFDVLSLHARGLHNVVAPLGTAFTIDQAKLIRRYAPAMVVLFDGDAAGKKAAIELRTAAREGGLMVKVASLPVGVDPDDYARQKGIEAVDGLLKNARGMLEHLIDQTIGGDVAFEASRQEVLQRVRQVAAYLAEEKDPSMRAMAKSYADEVASKVVVAGGTTDGLRALEAIIARALSGGGDEDRSALAPRTGPRGKLVGDSGRMLAATAAIGESAFGALLDFPELLDDPEVQEAAGELEGDVALGVAALRRMWDTKKSLLGPELLDFLPQAIHSFAVGRLASPRFSKLAEARAELLENVKKLRRRSLKGDKAVKVQQLAQAQGLGDTDAEDELLRELSRVAQEKRRLN